MEWTTNTHTHARNGTRLKASVGWCLACCRVQTAQFVYVNMYFIYSSIPYDKSTKSSPPPTLPLSPFYTYHFGRWRRFLFSLYLHFPHSQRIIMVFLFIFGGFVWLSFVLFLLLAGKNEFIHKHQRMQEDKIHILFSAVVRSFAPIFLLDTLCSYLSNTYSVTE